MAKNTLNLRANELRVNATDLLTKASPKVIAELTTRLSGMLRTALLAQIPGDKEKSLLAPLIKDMSIVDVNKVKNLTLKRFLEKGFKDAADKDPLLKNELKGISDGLKQDTLKIKDILKLDQPLKHNPWFADVRKASANTELLRLTSLNAKPKKAKALLDRLNEVETTGPEFWQEIVKKKFVTKQEFNEVIETQDLCKITEDNFDLVKVLIGAKRTTNRHLIPLQKKDWLKIFKANKIEPPERIVVEKQSKPKKNAKDPLDVYADVLVAKTADTFPNEVFFDRASRTDPSDYKTSLSRISGFLKKNPKFALEQPLNFRKIKWPTKDIKKRNALKKDLQKLKGLLRRYPDLELEKIINSPNEKGVEKFKTIEGEIKKLAKFYQNNPRLDLATADFHQGFFRQPEESKENKFKINWKGILKRDQPKIIKQMKTYQRLFRIFPRYEKTETLLDSGYTSARAIVIDGEEPIMHAFANDPVTGKTVYSNALEIVEKAGFLWANAIDIFPPDWLASAAFTNYSIDLTDYIKSLPGFDDLFQLPKMCACEQCRSILSPAAYFVDLMRFIDLHITGLNVAPNGNSLIPEPLRLKKRRPELWDIPLDCKNTNTEIPYLQIVNEIMEKNITALPNVGFNDAYRALVLAKHPWNLPFNLPVEQIRLYLEHFQKSLMHEAFKLFAKEGAQPFGASSLDIALSYLGMTLQVYNEITVSTEQANALMPVYGLDPNGIYIAGTHWGLKYVETFLRHTGLNRQELTELLFQNLDKDEKAANHQAFFYINHVNDGSDSLRIEEQPDPQNPTKMYEVLINLSNKKLDRIRRFVMLAKHLNWSFTDLDWVLKSIGKTGPNNDIDQAAIEMIYKIKKWQNELKLPLDVLTTFWYEVKPIGKSAEDSYDPQDLFNRTFNHPDLLENREPYNYNPLIVWNHQDPTDATRNWLLSALEINDEELSSLTTFAGPIALTKHVIAYLFRITQLPKALNIRLKEFLLLLNLMGINNHDDLKDFAVLGRVIKIVKWIRASGFSVYQLQQIKLKRSNKFVEAAFNETDLRLLLEKMARTRTETTVSDIAFTAIDGVTELISKGVFDELANNGFILKENANDRFGKLAADFDPQAAGFTLALNAPFDTPEAEAKMVKVLQRFDQRQLVLEDLATFFELEPGHLKETLGLAGLSLDHPNVLLSLTTVVADNDPVPQLVLTFLETSNAYVALVNELGLSTSEIAAIRQQGAYLHINNLQYLFPEDVLRLQQFKELVQNLSEPEKFLNFFPQGNKAAKLTTMAKLFHLEEDQLTTLVNKFWPGAVNTDFNNLADVIKIKKRMELSSFLGMHIDNMLNLIQVFGKNYTQQRNIAATVLETFKAKYGDKEWKRTFEPFADDLREKKRSALANFLRWQVSQGQMSFDDLYQHLLVDVKMSSCSKVSRIKLAILSLQLYVHRCLMNLENGVDPVHIPDQEWKWMKNYRVWEANRKVFLYPESFIEPELRHRKTPFFKELQDEILGGEVNKANVEKAYRNYLNKFTEVANLKVVGNYYDAASEILYLFGRAKTDPSNIYFRKHIDGQLWSPWEKVELRIKADKFSPVFAYNKLFLCWLEKSNVTPEEVAEHFRSEGFTDSVIAGLNQYKAAKLQFKISYHDFNNKWIHPQVTHAFPLIEFNLVNGDFKTAFTGNYKYLERPYPHYYQNIDAYSKYSKYRKDFLSLGYVYAPSYESAHFSLEVHKSLNKVTNLYPGTGSYVTANTLVFDGISGGASNTYLSGLYEAPLGDVPEESYYIFASRGLNDRNNPPALGTRILGELIHDGNEVGVINTKPDWYVLDTRDEEFLIKKKEYHYEPPPPPLDPANNPPSHKFHFERLTTFAAHELSQRLFGKGGINDLLTVDSQQVEELNFGVYDPNWPHIQLPARLIDFEGAFGEYYWEVFFHIPFLIANQLNANQRFEEAQRWYHYIFNPTKTLPANQPNVWPRNRFDPYWRFVPFRGQILPDFKEMLTSPAAIAEYRENPFNPHAIARLRKGVYQKRIVMKYIDNLIDWAEQLFTRDTWESLTEATMLYVMAYNILGSRPPEKRSPCEKPVTATFADIETKYKAENKEIPEFWIEVENSVAIVGNYGRIIPTLTRPGRPAPPATAAPSILYFCIPENKDLRDYWKRVQDGLFKIRHCLNIAGIKRQLPIWEPPIDPMMLVRAVAEGRDIGTVLNDLFRPLPHYRFSYLLERATSFIAQLQSLGGNLLSALEKKDSEALARLNTTHEITIKEMSVGLKEKLIEEANENLAALEESRKLADQRRRHYVRLIRKEFLPNESSFFDFMDVASVMQGIAGGFHGFSAVVHLVKIGIPDGLYLGPASSATAATFSSVGSIMSNMANRNSTKGSYLRREQDWKLQRDSAKQEIEQIKKQIAAAKLRIQFAEHDKDTTKKNVEQVNERLDFLKDKFTRQELYQWMLTKLSGLYFEAYKLAYDLAKSAEKAYQFERDTNDSFITFGHWDSLRKGLLAGERLQLDLQRLEKAYVDNNNRTFEIEKTISLAHLPSLSHPEYGSALLELKATGSCEFKLPEILYDFDFPGHYCRKIKTVAVSVPAVVGPQENIKATLTQLNSDILLKPDAQGVQYLLDPAAVVANAPDASVLRTDWRAHQQIAVSRGINDSGVFELNFRDERYLPFEGSGAVSTWRFDMPKGTNRINFESITDVILNIKYTAKQGGQTFKDDVKLAMTNLGLNYVGHRLMSLSHEFATPWHRFMNPLQGQVDLELRFPMPESLIPSNVKNPKVTKVYLKFDTPEVNYPLGINNNLILNLTPAAANAININVNQDDTEEAIVVNGENGKSFGEWIIKVNRQNSIPIQLRRRKASGQVEKEDIGGQDHYTLDQEKFKDVHLIVTFTGTVEL